MMTTENFDKFMNLIFSISDSFDLSDEQHKTLTKLMINQMKPVYDRKEELAREKYALADEIKALKDELAMYKSLAKHGKIYASIDSTDCDMVSSYRVCEFDSIEEYNKWLEDVYEWAEGSTYINLISKDEHENSTPSTRDRIMEAYENGNGYSVII